MSARSFAVLLAFACLTASVEVIGAPADAAPDQVRPARTDAHGDPLPPGVIARLGSTRLFQSDVEELAFSPNDDILGARSYDGHLHLWDVRSGKEIHSFWTPGHNLPSPFAFSPDSNLIAFAHADKTVRICETATGKERDKIDAFADTVKNLVVDPAGNSIAMTGDTDSREPASCRAGPIHIR